jgi:hypothetical protein
MERVMLQEVLKMTTTKKLLQRERQKHKRQRKKLNAPQMTYSKANSLLTSQIKNTKIQIVLRT